MIYLLPRLAVLHFSLQFCLIWSEKKAGTLITVWKCTERVCVGNLMYCHIFFSAIFLRVAAVRGVLFFALTK